MESQGQQSAALAEGRRIYMGNLLYSVKPGDIEGLLQDAGYGVFEKIHISIDPVSGRNPGYCFVEFSTRAEAENALISLPGLTVANRPVKVGPCVPKTQSQSQRRDGREGRDGFRSSQDGQRGTPFQRWGDWGDKKKVAAPGDADEQGPYGALRHLDDMARGALDGRRLYVGGLGKMIDQAQNDDEIRELFDGFELSIVAIGKRITPHPSAAEKPGNHHYCFVDFASTQDADDAVRATHGKLLPGGGKLRVFRARGVTPLKPDDEAAADAAVSAPSPVDRSRASRPATETKLREDRSVRDERQKEIMQSNNWRMGPRA
ncbi:hypothetical protein B0T22DRAFT_496894 [Podospora appendiculata]|uniref:RRM domain-containing protein n=1 Tax=Podospora appendiculata TaxID=314037 RepID=A0AAE1CH67_9PEZI|nr:hypothetical protein B0T22DRAFT_496894 [Podospora appendiculata]